ncbi:MAG: cation:proton antiporter [Alphaproteobacteria bacterium]|nr:cation:proton antiporter [Alphaproteobacteria bacterium]
MSRLMGRTLTVAMAGLLAAGVAWAAAHDPPTTGNGMSGSPGEARLIAQIALLLIVGRGLGELMQRIGQPAVVGQLLAGLILGPSFFGWLLPHAHHFIFPNTIEQKNLIAGLSDMGVLMLLLLTGMETDLKLVRRVGGAALAVSAAGVAVPFASGFLLGQFIPASVLPGSRLVASLFLGTALSISSIKIVAMVVREMNFMRRNLGQIIVASAIIEDTVGWIIISITLAIAGVGTAVGALAGTVFGTVVFLIVSYTIGRRLAFSLIRWVNDTLVSEYAVVTAIFVLMCALAVITWSIGVNTVLGAFVAGVLVGESPILSQHLQDEIRGFITAFMMPIFFGLSGLSADLTIMKDPYLIILTLVFVLIASFGKFAGAFLGGRIGGLTAREAIALGCGMNARGSTEVIVATIGLSMGALTQNLYTMIVTMAVITTVAMPPMLRWALGRLPMSREERLRIEKEELDTRGFVSRFERLLIAADDSASGQFASRIAGYIAGQRGVPVTVLQISDDDANPTDEPAPRDLAVEGVAGGRREAQRKKDATPGLAQVSARVEQEMDEAVAREARKGYDVLFIGLTKMRDASGSFSQDIERAVSGFLGPLVLVLADDVRVPPQGEAMIVLVPVDGTEMHRKGAELAFAITPPAKSKVVALHVAERTSQSQRPPRRRRRARTLIEKAVLEDTALLGRRYGFKDVDAAVHTDVEPDAAIIDEAQRSGSQVIVMGATRRVGEHLFLGQTVSSLMKTWKGILVLVVT